MNAAEDDRGPGRIVVRADEPSLTAHAGLAISGEICRKLRLRELIDSELDKVWRAAPIKSRRRGCSPAQLVLALAESQLTGGDCFDDLEKLRADTAGAVLRAVPRPPSAPTARQLGKRVRRSHVQAVESALAQAGARLDALLGRDPGAAVTLDLDAMESVVYGRRKQGAAKSRSGQLAYQTYAVFWAQRGRPLSWELEPGNRARCSAQEAIRLCKRALAKLLSGHGPVDVRVDSGFYAAALMIWLHERGVRFTISAPRTTSMWRKLNGIRPHSWQPAIGMDTSEVAETVICPDGWDDEPLRLIVRRTTFSAWELSGDPRARRRRTIPAEQLQMLIDGQTDSVYGYSFIVTNHDDDRPAVWVEHHHRHRAQIEERNKDAKLGQALRHLPAGNHAANRLWQAATMTALTLAAMTCDLSPAAAASHPAPAPDPHPTPDPALHPDPGPGPDPEPDLEPQPPRRRLPQRRHGKTLRSMFFCVPARLVRHGRQRILRLQHGFPHADVFKATYDAAWALPPP